MEGAYRGRESFDWSGTDSLTGEWDGRYDDLSMASSNAFRFITQDHEAGSGKYDLVSNYKWGGSQSDVARVVCTGRSIPDHGNWFPDWLKLLLSTRKCCLNWTWRWWRIVTDYQGDVAKEFSANTGIILFEPNNVVNRAFDIVMCYPLVDMGTWKHLNVLRKRYKRAFTVSVHPVSGLGAWESGLYLINYGRNFELSWNR